jgi:hypothetical protein
MPRKGKRRAGLGKLQFEIGLPAKSLAYNCAVSSWD